MATSSLAGSAGTGGTRLRRASFASLIGTTVEWYDFYLYVFCSALIFPKVFFPNSDPSAAYLNSMGTLVAAFLSRPVGAFIFGHFGDTKGRKVALVVTLLAMGLVTFLIGLVPGYATWGYWSAAALISLRLLQGVFFGGEWGGAVLMTLENAPPNRRGWYGVFSQLGNPVGFFLASGVLQIIALTTSPAAFLDWGWRIAFLVSALLIVVGLYARLQTSETRDFEGATRRSNVREAFPLRLLFTQHIRPMVLCLLLQSGLIFGSYVLVTYGSGYAQSVLGLPARWMFTAGMVSALVNVPALLLMAWLSDRVGRKPIYAFGLIAYVVLPFVFYWLLGWKTLSAVILANALVWGLGQAGTTAVQSSFLAELFPIRLRYSGISIAYQLSSVVIGIPVSFVPVFIMRATGNIYAVAAFGALGGVIGLLALSVLPETFERPLEDSTVDLPR